MPVLFLWTIGDDQIACYSLASFETNHSTDGGESGIRRVAQITYTMGVNTNADP